MDSEAPSERFANVAVTPTMSAAAEELRRMGLEDESGDPERGGEFGNSKEGAMAKGTKSLPCLLCDKMIRPSLFERCAQCELCSGALVERKCLRETMLEMAGSENAVDSKGRIDFTVESAGFGKGRMLPFTKGSGPTATMAGKCGYKMPELGVQKPILRFICQQCVDATKTPGRKVVSYESDDEGEEEVELLKESSEADAVQGRFGQDELDQITALVDGVKSGVDGAAAEILSDFIECSPMEIQKVAKTQLGWTRKGFGLEPNWVAFLKDLSLTLDKPDTTAQTAKDEDAASARFFLQLLGDRPVELGSVAYRVLVKNLSQRATKKVSQAFELVVGWNPNNKTFEDLSQLAALKATLGSFVPDLRSTGALKKGQSLFRDLGSVESLIGDGRSNFEGQSSWEAGAREPQRAPVAPARVQKDVRSRGQVGDGARRAGAAGGRPELQDAWTGMTHVVNSLDQHDAKLAGEGPAPVLLYTLCWTVKELEWVRKQMLEDQRQSQLSLALDLVETDGRGVKVQKALQCQVRPLKDMTHLELDHYLRMARVTVTRNWPDLVSDFERFVTICLPKDPLYWPFGAQVTVKNQGAHHEEHKAKIHLVRWFLRTEGARTSGLDIEQHWMRLKSQAGGKLTLLQGKRQSGERAAESDSEEGSVEGDSGREDLEPEEASGDILAQWGDTMNKADECRNCHGKGHSAPFCFKSRRKGLPCQLCLGRHAEKDCQGPGHVSKKKWRSTVVAPFLNRIGGNKRKASPGGAGAPETP